MKKTSLSVKLPLLFTISLLIIMLVVVIAVHQRFQQRMIDEYTRMAEGVTQLMADRIDGDKIDEYIEQNFESEKYRGIVDYFYTLKENYPDVLYLYTIRCEEDGAHVVFDLDNDEVENGEAYEPGYVYELEGPFAKVQDKIMAGEEIPGYDVHSVEDGYLFSYCRPVFDSKGNYACSTCVDFSMDHMYEDNNAFTLRLTLVILIIAAVILVAEVLVVRRWVTIPVNELSKCAEKFSYETEEDRGNNIDLIDDLDIRSEDEIGALYQLIRSMTRDSFISTFRLTQARQDIQDREVRINEISEDAYKDQLTKVGTAAAFNRDLADHDKRNGEFLVVMFDVNALKHINDNYGHGMGDEYLRGCCAMICSKYKHSPVYRLGGDEFVVLPGGEDFDEKDSRIEEIRAEFAESYAKTDAEPWERYSAACGMGRGETISDALKKADEAMYEDKKKFHMLSGHRR